MHFLHINISKEVLFLPSFICDHLTPSRFFKDRLAALASHIRLTTYSTWVRFFDPSHYLRVCQENPNLTNTTQLMTQENSSFFDSSHDFTWVDSSESTHAVNPTPIRKWRCAEIWRRVVISCRSRRFARGGHGWLGGVFTEIRKLPNKTSPRARWTLRWTLLLEDPGTLNRRWLCIQWLQQVLYQLYQLH